MKFIFTILVVLFAQHLFGQDSTAIVYASSYTTDNVCYNQNSKLQHGMLGQIDLSLELNTENAGLWKHGTAMMYIQNNHGAQPTGNSVLDLQTFSNIEAPNRTKLYEMWYKHEIENFWIKIGQQNINADFVYSETGLNFINSSFGVIPTVSGNIPVSIFPNSTLGISSALQCTPHFVLRGNIMDGDTKSEFDDPYGIAWNINKTDGYIGMIEGEFQTINEELDLPSIVWKIGYVNHHYTVELPDEIVPNTFINTTYNEKSIYSITDFVISRNSQDPELGWRGFIQAGYGIDLGITKSIGCGISFLGVRKEHYDDVFSIGYTNAIIDEQTVQNNGLAKGEHVFECNYSMNINSNITIQPDIQYIYNTGSEKNNNYLIGLLRFVVSFENE